MNLKRKDPTCDLDSERGLIGCAFIDAPAVISDAMSCGITADSFTDSRCRVIWEAMVEMLAASEPIAPDTVLVRLRKAMSASDACQAVLETTYEDLSHLVINCPTTARAQFFRREVMRRHLLRKLQAEGRAIVSDVAEADAEPAEDILREVSSRILAIEAQQQQESWEMAIARAGEELDAKVDPAKRKDADAALSLGWPITDARLGVMAPGEMVVIAARPSVGKSSFARQIALSVALKQKRQVLFASLEVIGSQLVNNFAQTLSGVSLREINPRMHPDDLKRFRDAQAALKAAPLDVLAAGNVSLAAIQSRLEVLRAAQKPVSVVVVDYIGLLPDATPSREENRTQSVGRVSRTLKQMALKNNCVVIVLSQLNRASEIDNREPRMSDLRESGDIEQDADRIIMLHRPTKDPVTREEQDPKWSAADVPTFYVEAIQAKGRNDGTGMVPFRFKRNCARFEPCPMPAGQ